MINRDARATILDSAKYFPVVAILGPRQSGKSTLAQAAFPDYAYFSLEDFDTRTLALNDPRTLLKVSPSAQGLIIDEFQYAPDLLSYIKTMVDTEQRPGYFILTGSQNFLMNQAITQSLAGRVALHTLLPLSVSELKQSSLLPVNIEVVLYQGSYPAIYSKQVPVEKMYGNYLQTYVERDVRQLTQVGDLALFQTFITLCAARIGQILNLTSLANDCGISDQTARRWIDILQASYIIYLLQPYYQNFGKRLIKSPKIYFYDSGLACYLLKIKQDELITHPQRGHLFETFVITELIKNSYNAGHVPSVYFWRDNAGHEVDCLIDQGLQMTAIEIKASRTVNLRFFENLDYLVQVAQKPRTKRYVVYAGESQQVTVHQDLLSWQDINLIL